MFVNASKGPEQLEALALTEYINELTRRLDTKDLVDESDLDDLPRPLSPQPEYDRSGKRTNTREQRKIQELEIERTSAVSEASQTIPGYVPPATMTKSTKMAHKVFLPVREYPHINFVGLLLGPRGNTLRQMEEESGAKISIRGRGSVKEGGRLGNNASNNEDLHCVVTAIAQESIDRAQRSIEKVVSTAVETPEHKNDFKRSQLRQLAESNGTLRDYENELCGFCRSPGHRKYDCPDRLEIMKKSKCRRCGFIGHFEKDCTMSNDASDAAQQFLDEIDDLAKIDSPEEHKRSAQSGIATGGENSIHTGNHAPTADKAVYPLVEANLTATVELDESQTCPLDSLISANDDKLSNTNASSKPPQFKLAPPKPFLPRPSSWKPK